ncbi:IS66 family transposase [Sphingobium yanoikuyae]|uniref:IS66 family transposase n=1 Tax=Sphingobium yanoikuyae TaxID=13690 RepID=UPI00293CC6AB|nr:IS66 family transposase [Sphingobium yanoikuyae]MDV3482263.1 IS66 family transposase [Sphingobium yanoikuyae]
MVSSNASDELVQLRAELAIVRAQALVAEAEVAKVWAINADLRARNAHLELMNEQMRREKYGARSERSRRLLDQLELTFEELEANASEAELLGQIAAAKTATVQAFTRTRSTRRDFPADLPREQVVIPAPDLCPCCGSDDLSQLPAAVTETLERVPARHKVIQTVREKVSCRQCEKISQPPAPFHVTPRGMFGPHFLVNLAFQKYGLHQPLNSQRDRLEAEGIPLSLSTLGDQIGAICVAVKPLFLLLEAHGLAADRLHADDTTVPLLAKLKTSVARIWDYVRDDRPFGGTAPPVALCYYSSDRRGEHPRAHLAGYAGILQVDRYAGFNALFEEGRTDKPMTRANCWVHARREFFKLVDIRQQLKRRKKGATPLVSPLASEALEIIDRLFAIERDINGKPAAERLAVRRELSAPIVAELETWMRETRSKLSRHDAVAKAIAYLQNDWDGFTTFLADGRVCLSNNAAERELRSVARGRKAWLFVGSDRGGQRAAMMFSLFGTARLNDVDPLAWFTDVLARIADIPQSRLHELLPWNWKAAQQQLTQEIAA